MLLSILRGLPLSKISHEKMCAISTCSSKKNWGIIPAPLILTLSVEAHSSMNMALMLLVGLMCFMKKLSRRFRKLGFVNLQLSTWGLTRLGV